MGEKQALIPRLRFPEYRDAGAWSTELGNAVFDQISNKNHNSNLPVLAITQKHGAIPRDLINYHVSVSEKSVEGYKVVEVGDFIISLRSFQGGIEFSRYKGICSPAYVILRLRHGYVEDYFRHYLKTSRFIGELTRNLEGLRDGKMISYKQFSDVDLHIPQNTEQQKIADCLSSLDELISAQAEKIDALKTYKKGLMQQLFPCEGETAPRLRFPEFRDAVGWKLVRFSSQIELISGLHLAPDQYASTGEVPYFTGPSDYSNSLYSAKKWTKRSANVGRSGDTLITVKGNGVGELLRLELNEVAMGRQLMAVRPSVMFGAFAFYFLETQRQRLTELASGNLIPGLSRGDILNLKVLVPKHDEQQKIADCLSSLDALIAAQSEGMDTLKDHKKGLMQQLFPSVESIVS